MANIPKIKANAINVDFDASFDIDFELVAKKYSPLNLVND